MVCEWECGGNGQRIDWRGVDRGRMEWSDERGVCNLNMPCPWELTPKCGPQRESSILSSHLGTHTP